MSEKGDGEIPEANPKVRTLQLTREGGGSYGLVFSASLVLQKVLEGGIGHEKGAEELLGYKLRRVNGKDIGTRMEVANMLCKEKKLTMVLQEYIEGVTPETVFQTTEEKEIEVESDDVIKQNDKKGVQEDSMEIDIQKDDVQQIDESNVQDDGQNVNRDEETKETDNQEKDQLENQPIGEQEASNINMDSENILPEVKTSIKRQKQEVQPPKELIVMTYNILSDWCCEVYRAELYAHIPDEHLKFLCWEYRKKLIQKDLIKHNADVICLQEVDAGKVHACLSDFLKNLGYLVDFVPKTKTSQIDGSLVAWNPNSVTLIRSEKLKLQKNLKQGSPKPQVCLISEFTVNNNFTKRGTPKRLLLLTSHIFFAPARGDIKMGQCSTIISKVRDYMCGWKVDSHLGRAALIKRMDCGPLVSAYKEFHGREPWWTTSHGSQRGTVDYIFTSGCEATKILEPIPEHNESRTCLLPSSDHGSDHLPVVAALNLVSPRSVILCGDFNCTPDSLLYNFVISGGNEIPTGQHYSRWSGNMAERPDYYEHTTLYGE